MRLLVIVSLLSVLFFSCGGSDSTGENSNETDLSATDSTGIDTVEITIDPNRPKVDIDKLLSKAQTKFDLPLIIDSAFIADNAATEEDEKYNLTMQEARYLNFDFVKDNVTGNSEYDITTFIFMDSIRQAGKKTMNEYQASLDLGMTRYSNANVIGKIEVSDISLLLLWHTDYATYEACPYGWGSCIYVTLFTKGNATNTLLVGEYSGGGDPPVWGDRILTSTINASHISIKCLDRNGEEDYETGEEIIEQNQRECKIDITPYGMVTMENKGE